MAVDQKYDLGGGAGVRGWKQPIIRAKCLHAKVKNWGG